MATVTESDIQELKTLIQAQTEQLSTIQQTQTEQFNHLQKEITELKLSIAKIEGSLESQQPFMQKLPDLLEKVGELKNWKQIGLVFVTAVVSSIFSGTIGGVIGWLLRSAKL
jgi:predicted  nucleic acid-binding Zn-ribbon protein